MRPIDIARKLKLSTSALRNYEAHGLVPPVERSTSGYRKYTEEHVAYFTCIQAMSPGFGMDVTAQVMRLIQDRQLQAALWRVNEVQANLQRDKQLAERNLAMLEDGRAGKVEEAGISEWMTIGEVATMTSLPSSTIRHWEKVGLITTSRDEKNGYRLFNRSQIRKIMLLRTLRPAVYSLSVVELKEAIASMNEEDVKEARNIALETLRYLDQMNLVQMRGVFYFYQLGKVVQLVEE
ncbi:MerR family DNA-binding transcriptional regulator [Brevibacillus sp. RS1.1]|uniref:MerR family DNA-binding transcriptional regulator n=1 Tax=Brevibacillus sp. RS1.1 TaxID=2738982 RepID=UPI00156AF189|nr:MerR family DNA-binding transcriptional regulator [Brevibacillus sp. RS1.1]NRR02282.1 MerR family DNA-binding transcriptional regulator [Brevibacillus sp. RS1.1]